MTTAAHVEGVITGRLLPPQPAWRIDSAATVAAPSGETGADDMAAAYTTADDMAAAEMAAAGADATTVRTAGAASAAYTRQPAADSDAAATAFLVEAGRVAAAWAHRRAFGLSSAAGVAMVLAACAATWFSAGTRTDNFRGVAALWAGYLVFAAGRTLTSPAGALRSVLRRQAGPAEWLAALAGSLSESVVYAGLAAGAIAEHWTGVWPLAIGVLGLVGVRNLMTACSIPPGFGDAPDTVARRISFAVLTMSLGGRVLLVGIVAPIWGARAALFALLDWAVISVGYGLAGRMLPGLAGQESTDEGGAGRSKLMRLRDDGALARMLGTLVRGNLLPLPPAVLGLVAISGLAVVGLHGLPGVLTLAPAIVMLLAAPGSGNPHAGRLDWLVPVLLLGSQFLYLAATGFAAGVPGPIVFVLAATLLLRYCDLAFPGRPVMVARLRQPGAERAERGNSLGWEGRMLLAGLAAATGVATFAYLALTAYLGVLIYAKVVTSSMAPREEHARDRPGHGGRREPPPAS